MSMYKLHVPVYGDDLFCYLCLNFWKFGQLSHYPYGVMESDGEIGRYCMSCISFGQIKGLFFQYI